MATYELRTFSDLYTAVMEEMKIPSSDTVSKNRIKRDINMTYLNEVCPYERWKWLRGFVNLTHEARIATGTASVSQNSVTVTLTTAPGTSKRGHWFCVDGNNEIYKIAQHTAASTTIVLSVPYTGSTSTEATYKIWTDKIPLPSEARDTVQVTHNFMDIPMESMGLQQFRKYVSSAPKAEGRPRFYTTSDYVDDAPYSTVGSLPALSTRATSGLVKTLVFASSVASLLEEGDRIEISNAGHYSYNGEFVISSVSTTTITYTGLVPYVESATADASLVLKLQNQEKNSERYKELWVYPSIDSNRTTLSVDYTKEPLPLIEDDDEPLIPIGDRVVLLYGALMRGWSRERNNSESQRNATLYERKLAKMAGKLDDSTDLPVLKPGKTYLASKRQRSILGREGRYGWGSGFGGSSAPSTPTGTASRVAIFDATGLLVGDSLISTTELEYLDGITAQVVSISDTQTLTNKTIDADLNTIQDIANANIKAAAGIAVNKLAALTASRLVVSDSSGFLDVNAAITASRALVSDSNGFPTASAITATEVTYLDDNEALTTFAMSDNQAAAANVATWAHASFTAVSLEYSISRGAGNRETGNIRIATDGTTAGISQSAASIGTIGVTFTVDISGTDLRLRYTSTSTGTAPSMKYKVQKWLA